MQKKEKEQLIKIMKNRKVKGRTLKYKNQETIQITLQFKKQTKQKKLAVT